MISVPMMEGSGFASPENGGFLHRERSDAGGYMMTAWSLEVDSNVKRY